MYFENPVEPAELWRKAGATHLHVVDLDGAFTGSSENLDAVREILEVDGLSVQLGGGMRDESVIASALEMGLSRVIIGTRACTDPQWVISMIHRFGADRIVVGIDAKDGMVATQGWVETSTTPATELAKSLSFTRAALDCTHGCINRWGNERTQSGCAKRNGSLCPCL